MNEEKQNPASRMQQGFRALKQERIVKQTIVAELEELMPKSAYYKKQLDTAKTNTKRRLMQKRLKKNNQQVISLIAALQKLDSPRGTDNELSIDTRRVTTPISTEEPVD